MVNLKVKDKTKSHSEIELYSFDIFDTLITRTTATPCGIFPLMQKEMRKNKELSGLLPEFLTENFFDIRVDAESCAAIEGRKRGIVSIRLDDIYRMMCETVEIEEATLNKIYELEIAMEIKNSVAIWENINKLKELILNGRRVILISDMYISEKDIRKILIQHDRIFEKIPIYVSCECNQLKRDGKLFAYVQKKENVEFSKWEHTGDNKVSDVEKAKKYGIHAYQYQYVELNWREKNLFNEKEYSDQLLFGAEKNVRLQGDRSFGYRLGSYVGTSILIPYVLWILHISMEHCLTHLFFVSRDGYLLKKIADGIIQKNKIEIITHYIYGSREAWRVCNDKLENISDVESMLRTEKAKMIREYMNQELAECNDNFAFVDMQGTGLSEEWLARLVPGKKFRTFFLHKVSHDESRNTVSFTYMLYQFHVRNVIELELLTRAPHGRVVDYQKNIYGLLEPVFDQSDNSSKQIYDYEYESGILDALSFLMLNTYDELAYADIWKNSRKCLIDLIRYPDREMASYLGEIYFERMKDGHNELVKFAPEFTEEDIRHLYLYHDFSMKNWKGYSTRYAEVRSGEKLKKKAEYYKKIDRKITGSFLRVLHFGLSQIKKEISKDKGNAVWRRYSVNINDLDKKVAVYGAGNVGQEIYEQLKETRKVEVIGWYDKNAEAYQKIGMQVQALEDIHEEAFDQLIICVKDGGVADNIKENLVRLGIPKDKIYWNDYIN